MSPPDSSPQPCSGRPPEIFLAAAALAPPREENLPHDRTEWVYYGDDPEVRRRWRRRLGRPPVDLGPRLDRAADRLRAPTLRLQARVAARNEPLTLHISHAFDLNCMVSPLFLRLCRLEITRKLAKEHAGLLVVVGDPVLYRVLARNEERLGVIVRELGSGRWARLRRVWRRAVLTAKRAGSLLKAVGNAVICLAAGRRARRRREEQKWAENKGKLTVLRSWANPDSFVQGEYQERYLPGLRERLEEKGVRSAVWLSVPTTRLTEQLKVLRRAADTRHCFTPWEVLRARDLLWALAVWWQQRNLDPGPEKWEGWQIGGLLEAERDRFLLRGGGYRFLLEHRAWRRLRENGVEVERLIHTFENMFHEKPLVLGLRNVFSQVPAVGFQHSTPFPNQLVMMRDESAEWGPEMPDVVVTSGRMYADQLQRHGYPEERLREGPALRFRPLADEARETDRSGVLVALPLALPEARYLWDTFLSGLELGEEGWQVKLKPHPMMERSALRKMVQEGKRRAGELQVAEGNFGPLVAQAECLVATASSVLLDGVLAGTPVVRVKHSDRLNFDPLDWIEEAERVSFEAFSEKEVAAALRRIREGGEDLRRRGEQVSEAVSRDIFSAGDDVTAFLI